MPSRQNSSSSLSHLKVFSPRCLIGLPYITPLNYSLSQNSARFSGLESCIAGLSKKVSLIYRPVLTVYFIHL